MSLEQAQEFFKKVEEDASLGEEYRSLLRDSKEKALSEAALLERVVRFAEERGASFSAEDTKDLARTQQSEELSDEALDKVAGGAWTLYLIAAFGESRNSVCLILGVDGT